VFSDFWSFGSLSQSRVFYAGVSLFLVALIAWGATTAVPPIPKLFAQQDKLEHIMAFGALTLWLSVLFGTRNLVLVAGLAVLGSISLEWVQSALSATREGSWGDLLASLTGVALAVGFVMSARHFIRTRRVALQG